MRAKLSVSNIAWGEEADDEVYRKLTNEGFSAIEIAPTRLITHKPYDPENILLAVAIVGKIREQWGFSICSTQSIWYGITQKIFGTIEERDFLYRYTCSALDFAAAVGCCHVVFGSPKNRVISDSSHRSIGEVFFTACAEYAAMKNVVIGIEANPSSYGTNYLNTTYEALELVQAIGSPFLKINLDLGTILSNQENLNDLSGKVSYISHVHISEPFLAPVIARNEHFLLRQLLNDEGYQGFISLEMKNSGKEELFRSIEVVAKAFNDE